ncbi:nuclear pore complex protein Nup88 [Glossina fuscipes fuscipes]
MSSTDFLELNQTAMFAKIRNSLPVERQHSQNLLESKDDLLYVWNSQESCLLVVNWRTAIAKGHETINYQTLIPSTHLTFDVERVISSNEGTLIALAGSRGICIMELPCRWGATGQFMQGKLQITCRTSNLGTHLFNNNPHLQLLQVRWHPASPTDSHLLALLSDNTIRVYDNASLRHVWQVGPLPLRNDTNPNASIVYSLEVNVIDFDIAPPVTTETDEIGFNVTAASTSVVSTKQNTAIISKTCSSTLLNKTIQNSQHKPKKIQWPLVILRENGNIYVLMAGLDTEKPRLQGPLTITPSSTDNYGVDYCSLLVVPSLPPTLVIAETNGKLHHAMFLEAEVAENSFDEVDESLIIHPCEWTVHILETVELELGLPKETTNQGYYCPIFLKRDFINELRYFAYHNTGLHVVTINFIAELERFLENEITSDINSICVPSHAEYVVCTKIDSGNRVNAVLGFVIMQMPNCAVLLLSSGQVLSLKLIIDLKLLSTLPSTKTISAANAISEQQHSQLNELLSTSFVDDIRRLLKRDVTQPILSLDKSSSPTPQECNELLIQAIKILRTQYLKKHELVRAEFNKRILTLKLWKERQKQDISDLEEERNKIRDNAHKLAEKFEELREQQEVLTKRYQDLMRQANTRLPGNNLAQKEFAKEVERLNDFTKKMSSTFEKYKNTINKQNYQIAKYQENSNMKTYELPEAQERTIKDILLQINTEIDSQVMEVKRIGKIVS